MSLACLINRKPITCLIHSVQYVPALTYALLSCRPLTHHGLRVIFDDDTCHICHRNGTIITELSGLPDQLYFLKVVKSTAVTKSDNGTALTATLSFNLVHK